MAARLLFRQAGLLGTLLPRRNFLTGWFYFIPNSPDASRIGEVGSDRTCAEWILKCDGAIRWKGSDKWIRSYNDLPTYKKPEDLAGYKISDIDASGSCVMWIGFLHLDGTNVETLIMDNCKYLDDKSLTQLPRIAESLEHLQISQCPKVSDTGLKNILLCPKLKQLTLFDLPKVDDLKVAKAAIQKVIPECNVQIK